MTQSTAPEGSPSSEPEDHTLPDAPPANLLEEATDSDGAKGGQDQTNDGADDANKMSLDDIFDEDEDDEFPTPSNISRGLDTRAEDANKMSLDDMFDDEDEDDEFPTSSNISRGLDTRLTEPAKLASKIDVKLEDLFKDEEETDDEFFSGPQNVEESSPPPRSPSPPPL